MVEKLYKCLKCKKLVISVDREKHSKSYHPEIDGIDIRSNYKDIDDLSLQETLKI